MASLKSLLFTEKHGAKIGQLFLDATIREEHSYRNRITQWPVETGANMTDHIRLEPDRITLEGFVTNSPVGIFPVERIGLIGAVPGDNNFARFSGIAGFGANIFQSAGAVDTLYKDFRREDRTTHVENALDILLKMSGRNVDGSNVSPDPSVSIGTGLRRYNNMAMESLSIPRDSRTGEAMYFTAVFVKIETVATEMVEIEFPAEDVQNTTQSTQNKKVETPPASEKQEEKSISILKSAKSLF